ncbi:MAG TPA: DUF922 domain-containing protein [Flavipsychrobacter sp.]|nr:DUF922 domain-containing protein [Flavipsychrobacter sp.]
MIKIRAVRVMMVCACLITVFSIPTQAHKGEKGSSKVTYSSGHRNEISWSKDKKLSWDDFRGLIPNDAEEQTAAATYCGIGFETNTISSKNSDLKIRVYNTFYIGQSWARPEEMNEDVLAHEQGHFDLCELYTRKLRERMANVSVNVNTLKPVLRKIYEDLQREYQARQEDYEVETAHGVNLPQQKKWQEILESELLETDKWSDS